jgi:hypothetical protein
MELRKLRHISDEEGLPVVGTRFVLGRSPFQLTVRLHKPACLTDPHRLVESALKNIAFPFSSISFHFAIPNGYGMFRSTG